MPTRSVNVLLGFALALSGPGITQSPWVTRVGTSGCGSLLVPNLHTSGEMPAIGNLNFKIISENMLHRVPGVFVISSTPASMKILEMPIYVDPTFGLSSLQLTSAGIMTMPLPIPADANLAGSILYAQGFFLDTSLLYSLVHTHGLCLKIALLASHERYVIYDRQRYQNHFSGVASPAQAEALGRAIWAENQVQGFTYVKTEKFVAGGQAHWIIVVKFDRINLEFSLIPGGSSLMGDINGTGNTYPFNDEIPVHHVRVPPFLIARTEVTQDQFYAITEKSPWKGTQNVPEEPGLPASGLFWEDAVDFCIKTGLRLPSEAEWEYACRAGTTTCYNFGENHPPSTILGAYAWYDSNSKGKLQIVGQKFPNAFGLHDILGNVLEYCLDTWYGGYNCSPSDGSAFEGGPLAPERRIRRGGECTSNAWQFRSSRRTYGTSQRALCGLRPVLPIM